MHVEVAFVDSQIEDAYRADLIKRNHSSEIRHVIAKVILLVVYLCECAEVVCSERLSLVVWVSVSTQNRHDLDRLNVMGRIEVGYNLADIDLAALNS